MTITAPGPLKIGALGCSLISSVLNPALTGCLQIGSSWMRTRPSCSGPARDDCCRISVFDLCSLQRILLLVSSIFECLEFLSRPISASKNATNVSATCFHYLRRLSQWHRTQESSHSSGSQRSYILDMASRCHLRSAARYQLVLPFYQLGTYGLQAFSVPGPKLWNSLLRLLCGTAQSTANFGHFYKTFLVSEY